MSNMFSIFSGQPPCDNMHMSDKDFEKFFKDNWTGTHIWHCIDCNKRYICSNRYRLAEQILENVSLEDKGD